MKYVKIASLILVGAIALLFGAGYLLPEWHIASRTVRLHQSPEAVWRVLTDYAAMPQWRNEIVQVDRSENRQNGMPHVIWTERLRNGDSLPLEDLQSDPPRLLIRQIADPNLPYRGTWKFEIQPSGDGCLVKATESGYVHFPVLRVLVRFTDMSASLDQYLTQLAEKFGEKPDFTAKPAVVYVDDM